MNLVCVRCGVQIAKLGARGRMPKRCDECKKAIARERMAEHRAKAAPIKKICPWCNDEYGATDKQQECCSISCSLKMRAKRAGKRNGGKKNCKFCGKEFEAKADRIGLCSRKCGFRWQKIQRGNKSSCRNFFASENIVVACKHCGCEFAVRTTTGKTNKLYCSMECSKQRQLEYLKKLYAEDCWYRPVEKKKLVCIICKNRFEHGFGQTKTCSITCRTILREWKSNLHKRTRDARMQQGHVPYDKQAIFARDGMICYLCDTKCSKEEGFPSPSYPTIDHVIPLAKGGKDCPDNVRCACFDCNVHKRDTVGWRSRTNEQRIAHMQEP